MLEDRVALSHAAAAAEVASAATTARNPRVTLSGNFVTVPPQGIGGGDTTSLAGKAQVPRFGVARVVGSLKSNGSLPPPFSGTTGGLIVTSPTHPGSAVLAISGPSGDLSPTRRSTIPVTFRVVSATGQFAPFVGGHGTGTLILRSRPVGSPGGLVSGRFSLTLALG